MILSGLNGHNVQEQQHLKHVPSSTPPAMGEHLEPNSQMELVGHSIVLTSYPYPDPHYGGIMAYGAQFFRRKRFPKPPPSPPLPPPAPPPPLLPLPPPPQHHHHHHHHYDLLLHPTTATTITTNETISASPYLHESQHQHAMRRARGCGGHFLNSKKLDSNATNPSANLSGSDHLPLNSNRNSGHHEKEPPMYQDMHGAHKSSNGNNINGHGLSMHHYSQSTDSDGGDWFDQEEGSVLVSQAPRGPATTK
ncbi:hypothetical protein HYC85_010514 [Camellia sinensis]|uniref:Nuclear transcription factor Y subunit n=1 Tax=Camellia sinensis TaxID=4442 RepID=A0A7J7HI35_CAMSI|nr:hypothetical protein HYC85_010514 [Camellia sinensis]